MAEVKWTNEQLQAIQEKNSNILVAAAAGSGKTAVLVERIIHKIIDEQMDIDKILVVTFTNAAASEMRERILEAIYKKLEENPENVHLQRQIILLNKASICTIHSFCLDVIHNHFYEIDLPSNFKIADTAEIDLLKQEVLDDLFEQKYTENDKNFIELLENYTNYRGDEALQELVLKIYKFIQSSPFPIKWLQEKLELLKIEDKDISQTIWGKLIIQTVDDDIQESIMQLEVTKSKMALYPEMTKFYQTISEDIINLQDLQKYNSWDELYIKLLNFNFSKWPVDKKVINDLKEDSKEIRDKVKKHIKEKTAKLLSCSQEQAVKDLKIITPILEKLSNLVTEFTKNFAEKKKEKNCIDFNDIEHFALKILLDENNNPTEVAKKYKEKFEEIAIDEYQDSNLVQEAILTSISKGNNIFMVGDVKQSIYKFRQARPELFLQKYDEYKNKEEKAQEDNLKIQLFRNFRSRQNILNITNLVFESIMSKELGDINYNENEYLNYGANYPEPEEIKNYAGIAELDIIDLKEDESITAFEGEEDEEEQERVEDDVLEAKFVANKIQELLNSNYMVFDKKQGYRKIRPKDIVILLRATSNLSPIYEKELSDLELPVFSDTSGTYLDTVEIQTILSVLKIIDNPLQDIPLVVVLRSSICNFTDNDLITIRLTDRNCNFYEALIKTRLICDGDLKNKIESFLEKLEKWKSISQYMPLDEFIWQIYLDTGYYQYVGLLPNGAMRQANLKTLFEKAKQYEKASFKGLFNFIQFIDKLKKQNGDLASAKLIGENEDVIRIMSIHKSKGLEFPVVFLCNSHKKFNMQDLNDNILLHQDIGFGPTIMDTTRKIKYSSIAKDAIKLKMKQETLSEEQRILYVALTRAKEKLYITGRSKDFTKYVQDKNKVLEMYESENIKLDAKLMKKANSYLDWLMYVYLFNQGRTITLKGESYKLSDIITLNVSNKKDLLKALAKEEVVEQIDLKEKIEQILKNKSDEENKKSEQALKELLEWKYDYIVDTTLPTKSSVTKIKQEKIKLEEILKGIESEEVEYKKSYTPKFMQEDKKISSAEKGTLVHLCIQRLDERKDYELKDIQNMILNLVEKEIITQNEADAIDVNLIYQYTKSQLFEELRKAKEVHKEQPFYINIPAKDVVSEAENSKKNILVQGIIDLYYIDKNDNLVLIDFKTDYISNEPNAKEKILDKYKVQLEIYKTALEQALNRKTSKTALCLVKSEYEEVVLE
ncbi:aTP-dependent helicase/nuclease subunit A [Clostridium sp. CAG:567]|nr:aTP-dependent helicase/nuclease subunit A [Clostridium sp. CAG:567]